LEKGLLADITDGNWFGFGEVLTAEWRTTLELLAARMTGHRYGVGTTSATMGIALGLRAQLRQRVRRDPQWADGRDRVLVPDLTHASAHDGVLRGLAPELDRLTLVPIDAVDDATMDPAATEAYLREHGERVVGIVYATMYGAFGDLGRFAELAEEHDVLFHHDNALGGGALYDGRLAPTAAISGQGEGKATPAGEGGVATTDDPELARLMHADTDTGDGPGRLSAIPYEPMERLPSGNLRLGEHAAGLMAVQTLRAIPAALQARESRRRIQELLVDTGLFPTPVLWNAPMSEFPPFFMLQMVASDALEQELGVTPADVRAFFTTEGMCAERGFEPTHQDSAWKHVAEGHGLTYDVSARLYERSVIVHGRFLRDRRCADWVAQILERLIANKEKVRGLSASVPESPCDFPPCPC
jgi:dTDP-4-amino-4,6-dideoxygalactose transaminase